MSIHAVPDLLLDDNNNNNVVDLEMGVVPIPRQEAYAVVIRQVEGVPHLGGTINFGKWGTNVTWLKRKGSWIDWLVSGTFIGVSSGSGVIAGAEAGDRVVPVKGDVGMVVGGLVGFASGTIAGMHLVDSYVESQRAFCDWKDEEIRRELFSAFRSFLEVVEFECEDISLKCSCGECGGDVMTEVWRTPATEDKLEGLTVDISCLKRNHRDGRVTLRGTHFNYADCRPDPELSLEIVSRLSRLLDIELEREELSRVVKDHLATLKVRWAERKAKYRELIAQEK